MQIFFEKYFPFEKKDKIEYKNRVFVGIGGNVGDVKKRFVRVLGLWQKDRRVHVRRSSPILKNPPFGFVNQDDFYNAVLEVQTSMSPREFLKFLLHTEKRFKRVRSFKNAPRTLDLDIIFFNQIHYKHKNLQIPHPFWADRDSVLIPLSYMIKPTKG